MRSVLTLLLLVCSCLGLTASMVIEGESPLTNAEKLARGLPLNRPSRLYDAKRALRPRASGAASSSFIEVYRTDNDQFLGYIGQYQGYQITSSSYRVPFGLPGTSGSYDQLGATSYGAGNYYGLSYSSSSSSYAPNYGSTDGGSPSAATSFQTSVFSWTSASSQLTSTVVTSSGRTVVYGWTNGNNQYVYAQTAPSYATQIYFVLSAS